MLKYVGSQPCALSLVIEDAKTRGVSLINEREAKDEDIELRRLIK